MLSIGTLWAGAMTSLSVLILRYQVESRCYLEGGAISSRDPSSLPMTSFSDDTNETHLRTSREGIPAYGTLRPVKVEYINENFVTTVTEGNEVVEEEEAKPPPTPKSARRVWIALTLFISSTLGCALISAHAQSGNLRTSICLLLLAVGAGATVVVIRSPKHHPDLRFKAPCIPILPLYSLGMHLALMCFLPNHSWYRFLLWNGLGLLIYLTYSRRHSLEASFSDDRNEETDEVQEEFLGDEESSQ